ncbi:MAG: hypothetical protein K9I82_17965 [Chitinophagaceae bacterium]|nr:hypothetical protein [Chitinophagaceae bacterium]
MKHLWISILYVLLAVRLNATPKPIPPILSKLLQLKGSVRITYLGLEQWIEINDLPKNYKSEGQHLLKTNNGLYLTIPGTGRLYKAKITGDIIDFQRIDSTYYSGYNFNSLSFNFDTEIYNFGGEGFWQTNGVLRFFDTAFHEWNAIKLNKSIHKSFNFKNPYSFFYFLDNDHRNLFMEGNEVDQNYVKDPYADSTFKNKIFRLDISKGDWHELGIKNFNLFHCIAFTKFGILSNENLINIEKNKIYNHNLSLKISSILGNSTNKKDPTISFAIDSTIYFGNADNRFDSIIINSSTFTDTHQLAYIPLESSNTILSKWNILTFLFIVISIGFLFLLYKIYFKKSSNFKNHQTHDFITNSMQQTNKETIYNPIVYRSGKLIELLSDQEKAFISFVYKNSKDDRLTTIDEVNKILGTIHKSIDIQKRVRGEMINSINQKISMITKLKLPLINKQRSDFDKRSFEYFIKSENFDLLKDIIAVHTLNDNKK